VGLQRPARITAVSEGIEPRTRTYLVKAELDNANEAVKAGMFCTAEFRVPRATGATAVPLDAVHQDEGHSFIWVVRDGKAHRIFVELGETNAQFQQVLGDVPLEDRVIVGGAGALMDGTPVEIVNGTAS
jgi:multidrug efflux pump subunit AcrA (membrane-fusion protein)